MAVYLTSLAESPGLFHQCSGVAANFPIAQQEDCFWPNSDARMTGHNQWSALICRVLMSNWFLKLQQLLSCVSFAHYPSLYLDPVPAWTPGTPKEASNAALKSVPPLGCHLGEKKTQDEEGNRKSRQFDCGLDVHAHVVPIDALHGHQVCPAVALPFYVSDSSIQIRFCSLLQPSIPRFCRRVEPNNGKRLLVV